jgi:hypothetical protein
MNDSRIHGRARGRGRFPLRWFLLGAGLLVLAGAAGVFELREDPPSIRQPNGGDLTGTLGPAGEIASLSAISRATGRRYMPAEWSPATGRFRFRALPGDASYDLCLQMTDGRRVEGIDLSWFEARFERLAAIRRKQLGIPEPAPHALTTADVDELIDLVVTRSDFSDINRPLYIRGHGGKAVMLIERIRSERFHAADPGEVIWRTDLMYFTFDAGGWQVLPNTRRLVERRRFTPETWLCFTIGYDPRLTAYIDDRGQSRSVTWAAPTELPAATGRLAGQPLRPNTEARVIGGSVPPIAPVAPPGSR